MKIKKPTVDEVKGYLRKDLIDRIREHYSVDEEFRLLNRGVIDSQDSEFREYREVIDQLVADYQTQTGDIYERGNRD